MTPYVKQMTSRYLLALMLVAALALAGGWVQVRYDEEQQNSLATIQLAEQQRILSKRAAVMAYRLVFTDSSPERQRLRNQLRDISFHMQSIHQSFTEGDERRHIEPPDDELQRILYNAPAFLDREVTQYIDALQALAEAPRDRLTPDNPHYQTISDRILYGPLTRAMDRLVQYSQSQQEIRLSQRQLARNTVLGSTVLLLITIGLFIFRPMVRRVEHDMNRLDQGLARAEAERKHADFMADASRVLTSSLDQTVIFDRLSHLLVPSLADYCFIDALTPEGTMQRLATVHADPQQEKLLISIAGYRPSAHFMRFVHQVVNSGKPLLVPMTAEGGADMYDAAVPQAVVRKMNPRSMLMVPLGKGDRSVGIITLVQAESGRRYDAEDIQRADELALRTLLAIDNARLYRESRQALQERDDILGVVSHDLRNPLSVVLTTAGILLSTEHTLSDDAKQKLLRNVKRAAERMNRLIQDLLDVARIEAGQMSLQMQRVDPGSVVAEIAQAQGPMTSEKGIGLDEDIQEGLPQVFMDPDRIQQVLTNLMDNAIKCTPMGGHIHMRVRRQDDGLQFSVSDTGPGIPKDLLDHIFDRYWQVRSTGRAGAGLGLTIAKGIVEAHGGSIGAESEPGLGTTVRFTLPIGETKMQRTEPDRPQKVD